MKGGIGCILIDNLKICIPETLPETGVSNTSGFYLRTLSSPRNSAQFRAIQEHLRAIPRKGIPIGNDTLHIKKFTYILVNSFVLLTTVFCWFRSFLYNLALLFNPTEENNPNNIIKDYNFNLLSI